MRYLCALPGPGQPALTRLGSSTELPKARACRATIEGRGGNDVLRFSLAPDDSCQRLERRLLGGAGADTLLGSPRGDVIFGGGGRDVADGRSGNDQCRAEVRRQCERR